MSSACDHDRIFAAFGSRWTDQRQRAIADAYLDPHADALLAEMLDRSTDPVFERVVLAAHLGDLVGDAGVAALERAAAATGTGSRGLRCAGLLALAKRCGDQTTPILLEGLAAKDGAVKSYAVIGLAGAGDDRAWEAVFAHLRLLLRRTRRTSESEVATALAYLAQHVEHFERRRRLVRFIREHWDVIDESAWFSRYWPDVFPTGPAVDDVGTTNAADIRAWARDPLFNPLGVPHHFV